MNHEINKDSSNLSSPFRGTGGETGGISFIVAADEKNVMGKGNQLPWKLPNDMKYFKNQTWGMTVVMGRKTLDSLGKPLQGRKNIVITRNKDWKQEGVQAAHSLDEAIEMAKASGVKEIFIIGGAEIFKMAMPAANRIYLTRIHHQFDGDVYFPELPAADWELVRSRFCREDEKNKYPHTFQIWERK